MFCSDCGQENPDQAKFCGSCRVSLSNESKQSFVQEELKQQSQVKNSVGAKIAHIALFIWGGILIFVGIGDSFNWSEYSQEIQDQRSFVIFLWFASGISTIIAGYIRLKIINFLSLGTNKATILLTVLGLILWIIGISIDPTL